VKDEVNQVVYSNGEKQMVRKERFGHVADSQGLRLIEERYACGNESDDKKGHEVIADEKNQRRRKFRLVHVSNLSRPMRTL
jgi:hypothetical protein